MSAGRRPTLSLDGLWDFAFEGPTAQLEGARQIRSPGVWQVQFPELRNAHGLGRYSRRVELPPDWTGKRIVLTLEGVFHESVVRIDGERVGLHGDGWTTFEIDLTLALAGRTSFELGVDAKLPDDRQDGRFSRSLAAKQDWYGVWGGIWKPATLEARDPLHLVSAAVQTNTDLATGTVTVQSTLSQDGGGSLRLTLTRDGRTVAAREVVLAAQGFEAALAVERPDLWSPETPNLYELAIELIRDGVVVDGVDRVIGFRRFEAGDGRLWLNGQPFYMFGALDQDWTEDANWPPNGSGLEERFRNAKAMGLNTLRCHVKIPDREYLDLADRLGLVVWLDMPYPGFLAPETRETVAHIFRQSVATHGFHPSICVWTLFNEGWGIELDDNPDDRRWLKALFEEAKPLVPNALVVDNSPCFPRNYHVKTDIEDFHWYNGFPHQNEAFAATTRAFASRAAFPWSPHGDAEKRGDEPLVCSEFGIWGLPHPRDILRADGREPWWFESGHDWNSGAAYPHGIETRFRDAGLQPIFGDVDGFVVAAQEFQYRALKFQIETLRWEQPISGYVLTELNDVQWESNGLMDVRNRPRAFAARLAALQTPRLVIARVDRTALRAGETFEVQVRLAGAGETPPGAQVAWSFGAAQGVAPVGAEPSVLTLTAPSIDRIAAMALELEARGPDGRVLSVNTLELCVVPALGAGGAALFAIDEDARKTLLALGWPTVAVNAGEAEILVATSLTTPVRDALLAGRRVVLIANGDDALVDPARRLPPNDRHNFPQAVLRPRNGTPWDGQWMGAFAWRRMEGPWSGLPNGPMLDEHWAGLTPNHVLTGFLSTAFGGLVDAGMAVGWLHLAAGFVKRTALGPGWLTIATFDLTSAQASANPLAAHLLRAIVES